LAVKKDVGFGEIYLDEEESVPVVGGDDGVDAVLFRLQYKPPPNKRTRAATTITTIITMLEEDPEPGEGT